MAVSDAATTSPSDWSQLYHQSLAGPTSSPVLSRPSDSTVVTTVPAIAGIEGRVGKSSKRRSRASRKAPTTLLNTDTANFRSLVQQFTGVSSAPYTATGAYGPVINFSSGDQSRPQTFGLHQQYQMQQQYQLQPPDQYIVGSSNGGDVFFSGAGNPRAHVEGADGYQLDGEMMTRPPTAADGRVGDGGGGGGGGGYLF